MSSIIKLYFYRRLTSLSNTMKWSVQDHILILLFVGPDVVTSIESNECMKYNFKIISCANSLGKISSFVRT